jgi:predicted ester cyclase
LSASDNLALHQRWTEAEDGHDISHHDDFLHPDIVVHLPGGVEVAGLAAYLEMMQAQYSGLDGYRVVLDDEFATDDRVVCRWRVSGTHTGDFSGIPPTDRNIEFPGMSLWEFEEGKARRGWVLPDIASMMAQLSPPTGAPGG